MTKRLTLALLLSCSPLWATTYYVDNCVSVGNDRNNGTSASTPWLTINKVNTSKFNPGDSILFESTCTWREQLTVPSSGSAGSPITFGVYGTGAQPIISGADLFTSWTLSSGSVYYTSYSTAPNQVFEDGGRLTQNTVSTASLTAGQWYLDTANSRIWVYLTAGDNPSGHAMEASQRNYGISNSQNYVTLSGLETDKTSYYGTYSTGGSNVIITNVTAQWNYNAGMQIKTGSGIVLSYSTCAYNGGDGCALGTVPAVLVDHVIAHDNGQLYLPCAQDSCLQMYTAGIKFNGNSSQNMTVQYSESYNNGVGQPATIGVGIWADTVGAGFTAKYNLVYGNNGIDIMAEADSRVSILYNVAFGARSVSGSYLAEILLDADNASIPMANSLVANNVAYGNPSFGIVLIGSNVAGGCVGNVVQNNISVGNHAQLVAAGGCQNDGTYGYGNVYTYNGFGPQGTGFIRWDSTPWGTSYNTYSAWETAYCSTTGCSHSVQAAPTFANAPAGQFWLTSGSPGIGAGVNLGSPYNIGLLPGSAWPAGVTTGPVRTPPDIGAFVYVPPVALNPPTNLQAVVH
jgi:hypothetical protein